MESVSDLRTLSAEMMIRYYLWKATQLDKKEEDLEDDIIALSKECWADTKQFFEH